MDKGRRENQCKQILKWLETYHIITQETAIARFRCYRLSARIFDLREQGYDIKTDMVSCVDEDGYTFRFAQYRMVS